MSDLKHIMPFFIPIIAIVMGIGIGMLALWIDYQKKARMIELHHKERLFALERGIELPPLPPELFTSESKVQAVDERARSLRRGLIWLLLGLALGVAIALNNSPEEASWALLPMAVGIAQLLFYKISSDKALAQKS